MAIPDYQSLMLPLLSLAADGKEHTLRSAVGALAEQFDLSEEERRTLLPSGKQATFDNRVGWARTYLEKAGLLEKPRRGFFRITPRGKEVIAGKPSKIDVRFLEQFDEFNEFRNLRRDKSREKTDAEATTPEEMLELAHQTLKQGLQKELLETVRQCSPEFFEQLVVDLIVKMGYGGSRREAGHAIGRSGDEGIDGIVKEDRLGLDVIYLQAKRWQGVVGRPEIQKFAGALQGQQARKGIFITTSSFTQDAVNFASRINTKVVLIDGERLSELMIEHNIGVTPVANYEIKKLDTDYFSEE